MAYRRRRRGLGFWPRAIFALLIAVSLLFLFRHRLETRLTALADPVVTAMPALLDGGSTRAAAAPIPTFTITIERPIPLADVPAPEAAAQQYLTAWSSGDYAAMYDTLSQSSRSGQSEKEFVERYQQLTAEASITKVTPKITSVPMVPEKAGNGASVQVPFTVEFQTIRAGDFTENNSVSLVLEDGRWRVDWRPSLFFKDLASDDTVRLFKLDPRRGSILDRQGRPLATMGFRVQIGVIPGKINKDGHENETLTLLSSYLKQPPEELKKIYQSQPAEWFIPIGEVDGKLEEELQKKAGGLPGVELRRKPIRIYPEGVLASHIVGYVGHITEDELKTLAPKGYTIDDMVGRFGVEQWGDTYLSGKRGGKLAIVAPTGEVIKVIAERDAVPGNDLVLTLDNDIQRESERLLGNLEGSIIVMNPQDNSILAMASYPTFDPNKFITGFTEQEWTALNTSSEHPFQNRPAESVYATGSIFKVITMAAGMEELGYVPSSTFDCGYWWYGLPGFPRHNWEAQGTLNLIQSLTGSCDPTFYTMGLGLHNKNPNLLAQYTREFGLGQKTGVNGIDEAAGLVPTPQWKQETIGEPWYPGDSVILAIGQSFLEATPLQMTNAYSMIAVNGTKRTPLLVQKVVDAKGQVVETFQAQTTGRLPLKPSTLQAIHQGLLGVTSTALGTANYAFQSYKHPMESKTGSAENQGPLAHAWFVGYASPERPTVLIMVMIEGRGDSHGVSAPIARSLMDYLWPNDAEQPIVH